MAGLLPNEFDASKISFGNVKVNENKGKSIYVGYDNGPLIFQTPEMVAPFGVSKWDKENGGDKYSVNLSFKGKETREPLNKFFENLNTLNETLIQGAKNNSEAWFGNVKSEIVLRELITPVISYAKEKDKYPPTIKANLMQKNGNYDLEVYDESRNEIKYDGTMDLKNARITALIQCLGIWVIGSKFGITWKIVQMRVIPAKKLQGYAFKEIANDSAEVEAVDDADEDDAVEADESVEESDDDDLDMKVTPSPPPVQAPIATPSAPIKAPAKKATKK
jgi:hypothetical protein